MVSEFFHRKGEIIIQEGSSSSGVYCLVEGICKVSKLGVDGREKILRLAWSGDLMGHRAAISRGYFSASVVALGDCRSFFVPQALFLKMVECNSGVCFAVFKELNRVLADTSRVVMALTQKTVRERLAETFLRLDEELGTDMYGFIRVLFTREELANFVGAATESLIRLISEFKSAHLIEVSRRRIKILDRKRMMEIARVV